MRFSTNFQRKRMTGISPEHPKTQVRAEPNEALGTDAERTCQRAKREVEFFYVVAKLANI